MSVHGNISQAGHDTIAPVLGINEAMIIKDANKARLTTPQRTITLSIRISRRNEDHLLASNEDPHLFIEMIEHLL